MPKIVPIVEGVGEVEAVPKLLWKLLIELGRYDIEIAGPKNAKGCSNLTKKDGLEKFVNIAWSEPDCGAVLILMDADIHCPRTIADDFARRIQAMGIRFTVVIVLAKCEYEGWFLPGLNFPGDPEAKEGAKEWVRQHVLGGTYKPSQDQVTLTQALDINLVRERSRSFRRLCHAVEEALTAIDNGQVVVTPMPTG